MLAFLRRILTAAGQRRAQAFQIKYQHFKGLLEANSLALELMAEISDALGNPECFSIGFVRTRTVALFVEAYKIVRHLSIVSPTDGRHLAERYDELRTKATHLLDVPIAPADVPFVRDIGQIDASDGARVGSKSALLGEVRAKLDVPVPDGFAITTRFAEELRRRGRLQDEINKVIATLDYGDGEAVEEASRTIQSMVVGTPMPQHVEAEILGAYDRLCDRMGDTPRLAVRSSAIGEDDPRCSFAGLYYSALNVRRENLIDACFEVLVSKYLPRSMMYLHVNGLRDEDVPMCIGCIAMVDSRVSGTLFTLDPAFDAHEGRMIIQAVSGLASVLVGGRVQPDRYVMSREAPGEVVTFGPGNQRVMARPGNRDGVDDVPIPASDAPSLTEDELGQLARYAMQIERHFGGPQDIEWAVDHEGRVWILQCRPLLIACPLTLPPQAADQIEPTGDHPTLADEGDCASPGVGAGPVALVTSDRQLKTFPEGGVLVAQHSRPELTQVLHKASAIVTEIGGTTGHLAIMAREYRVPCLMNVPGATQLEPGAVVTVDADAGRIYAGRLPGLESRRRRPAREHPLVGTPVHRTLKDIADLVLPLNLADPSAQRFRASNCQTVHDIARFAHETALERMFVLGDQRGHAKGYVHRLDFSVPLAVYVIDVGGGLLDQAPTNAITPDHVASLPLKALIRGMTAEGVRWAGRVPIDLRGFVSVFANTMAEPHRLKRAMGDRSFAIISRNYLNFSSRLGYHFSTLDAYVSDEIHSNHISFSFKGGAADSVRRERRAVFIGRVLERFGFWVEQKADLVKAHIKRIDAETACQRLDTCGRLMGAVRQIDAAMTSDETIDRYVDRFMEGDYSLGLAGLDESGS